MDWPRQRIAGLTLMIVGLLWGLGMSFLMEFWVTVFIGVLLPVVGLLVLLDYTNKRLLDRIDRLERLVDRDEA